MTSKKPYLRVAAALVPVLVLIGACSADGNTMVLVGDACDGSCTQAPTPAFEPAREAGVDAGDVVVPTPARLCIATECPAPYATCGAGYRCVTNLSNDEDNCGECGNVCPSFALLSMRSRCVNGACALECFNAGSNQDFRDCNGAVDDGCEVNVRVDAKHCGACGNACAPGERCRDGQCGCPAPRVDCGGRCIDITSDLSNCGACGSTCPPPPCEPPPPNVRFGCSSSQCGVPVCLPQTADCNHDLGTGCGSDGCETDLTDRLNCGACGNVCPSGTECRSDGVSAKCLPICNDAACRCKPGETLCPNGSCVNLLHDAQNCGACGAACPSQSSSQVVTCEKGVCNTSCVAGLADCNGDPIDGCEVDLRRSPTNCGACGNRCDTAAGQPCFDGKCLMKECDEGETK
ncbi:MAG: hypothetical protein BGO98_42830 [Myxococcales bacterium 68-20]|nr:hypothetical protein [Myxococcales bacterium]OJY29132.1 MAG: hypothetical protein BGO98_42830 [Myxococcales bacterium 68-20]